MGKTIMGFFGFWTGLFKKKDIGMTSYWLLFILANIVIYNGALWHYAFSNLALTDLGTLGVMVQLVMLIVLVNLLVLFPIGFLFPALIKPLIGLLLLLNALALYGLVVQDLTLDSDTLLRLFKGDVRQMVPQFTYGFWLTLGLLGVLPAIIFSRYTLRPIIRLRLTVHSLFWVVVCVLSFFATQNARPWLATHQEAVLARALPLAYLINGVRAATGKDPFEPYLIAKPVKTPQSAKTIEPLIPEAPLAQPDSPGASDDASVEATAVNSQ